MKIKLTIALAAIIMLVACGPKSAVISVASSSPVPAINPTETPLPAPSVAIGPANASKVASLAILGDPLLAHMTYSPDGKWLVTSTSVGIKIYDASTLAPIQPAAAQSWTGAPIFSPDGKKVAFLAADKTISILDVTTGQVVQTLSGPMTVFNSMAFSPDW
jgi:WD40 repeat protein